MFPEQTPHPFQSLLRLILMVIGFTVLSQIIAILAIAGYYSFTGQAFSLA